MRIGIIGAGAVGARAGRQLVNDDTVEQVVVRDPRAKRREQVVTSLGERSVADTAAPDAPLDVDVVVLAGPRGTQAPVALAFARRGISVVTTTDAVDDIEPLLAFDAEARERGVVVAIGAGMAPGLSDVLARHAAREFSTVEEIHVAKIGTAGPACARAHHRALAGTSIDWRDGAWVRRAGGSGRELCWFPDPIGGRDCYRGALGDALVLVPAFAGTSRITARVAATRRDRLTARLPMLRPPHPEGGAGAIRVEVRGVRNDVRDVLVYGAMDRPSIASGAVASLTARWVASGRCDRFGAAGLAELVEPVPFLGALAETGVRCAVFEGSGA